MFIGNAPQIDNKLIYGLLGTGGALLITGVALSCIPNILTYAVGSLCLPLALPLLSMGLIALIIKNCQSETPPTRQAPPGWGQGRMLR